MRFLEWNVWIPVKISLKFVPMCPINNTPALVQIMAWRRPGDKPLSEPMMVSLPTHICVTPPQWVNTLKPSDAYALVNYAIIGSDNDTSPVHRVPTALHDSKLTTFQGPFQDQSRCFKDLYGKFHNSDMLKIYYLVYEEICTSQLLRKVHSIVCKISVN